MMMRNLCCVVLLLSHISLAAEHTLRVLDTNGKPLDSFQIMWHTPDQGYSLWQKAQNGTWRESLYRIPDVIDIIVRADGYATKVQRFKNESLDELLNSEATITLARGREVIIQLQFTDGIKAPRDFVMQSYFPQFNGRVRSKWQPVNIRDRKPDWNMLNVQRVDENEFCMRLPLEGDEFLLAFQHPGWLQFCELGPFNDQDVEGDILRVDVPKPATIEVTFDTIGNSAADLPFDETTCMVYWVPDESARVYGVTDYDVKIKPGERFTLTDLGPGKYSVVVRTTPKNDTSNIAGTEINPGQFHEREHVVLKSGEVNSVDFSWVPYDPDAYRGDARVRIAILNADGSVPVGRTAKISWYDGHYGSISVHEGRIPSDGMIACDGISAKRHRGAARFGPYIVAIDDERLGFFTLEDTTKVQTFEFRITPGIGDVAPDISLIDVESQRLLRLSDERGKVVFLEFWSVGCGPCQPAMQKLNDVAAEQPPDWHEKVTILSVSTDHDLDLVRDHVTNRGWTAISHFVGSREEAAYFSDAETAYVILGVPQAVLVDQTGKIVWRGHPLNTTDGKSIADRIESLLE